MKLNAILFAGLSITLIGCATLSGENSGSATSASPTALVLEVPNQPPTEMKPETKPAPPAPGHIWVAGYWDYIGGHHVWREGRWVKALAGYEYVRARYEWDGRSWQFHVPHWHRRAPAVVESTKVASRGGGDSGAR
jgi:hypothetical protein